MTKYDDASWHYEGVFPADLPSSAGSTHIAMFVAWCLLRGFGGENSEELADEVGTLTARATTPGEFLINVLDEKFLSDDMNDEGNGFTVAYYETKDGVSRYLNDYVAEFDVDGVDVYRVPDTWATYDRIAPRIERGYAIWVEKGRPRHLR